MASDTGVGVELQIAKGLYLLEGLPALYHPASGTLIVADVHLGYEDAMAEAGVYLPRLQLRHALEVTREAIRRTGARRVVIAGDLKHVFSKLTRQERIESVKFIRGLEEAGAAELVLVKGNHDTFISGVLKKLGVEVVDDYLDLGGGVVVAHGHKRVECDCRVIVIGHEHPALQVDVEGARVKLPLLLEVPLSSGRVAVVMPALGLYQTGNPVSLDPSQYLSPIVREEGLVADAVPWVVDKDVGTHPFTRLDVLLEAAGP